MVVNGKVSVRAIEESDLELLQSWRNNEDLRRYFREYREMSMVQKKAWFQDMTKSRNFEMFMIVDPLRNIPVGATGFTYIDWVNRHCDLHFYIGQDGKWIDDHYSPDAMSLMLDRGFNVLNMNKIWAEIYSIDDKKKDFFSKFGFSVDARLRNHYYYNGEYHDSYIYSLLREEYEQNLNSSCPPR